MKKLIISICILCFIPFTAIAWMNLNITGSGQTVASGGSGTYYLTDNTTDFDDVTYANVTVYGSNPDTSISSGSATYNYGGCAYITWSPTTGVYRGIIKFSINNIPSDSTISSVSLNFRGNGNYNLANNDVRLYRITDAHTFVEGSTCAADTNNVSWNNYSTGNSWTTAGVAYNSTVLAEWDIDANYNGWAEASETSTNLTDYVQNIVDGTNTDYGILMIGVLTSGTAADEVTSGEGTNGNRPYLEVSWTN